MPWDTAGSSAAIKDWDANKDVWELYDLRSDFSQADDLAAKNPKKLAEMKALFLKEAKANKAFPIGAGNWLRIHPEDRVKTPYSSWTFDASTVRMPEFTAPGLGRESNHVAIEAELGENATGVLYALGGFSGGLTLYMDKGELVYEYNMMEIERYSVRSSGKIAAGKRRIEVDTTIARPGAAGRGGAQGRRQRGRPRDRQANGAGGVHGERILRCRRRSRIAGIAGLFRPPAVQVRRQDREGRGQTEIARWAGGFPPDRISVNQYRLTPYIIA